MFFTYKLITYQGRDLIISTFKTLTIWSSKLILFSITFGFHTLENRVCCCYPCPCLISGTSFTLSREIDDFIFGCAHFLLAGSLGFCIRIEEWLAFDAGTIKIDDLILWTIRFHTSLYIFTLNRIRITRLTVSFCIELLLLCTGSCAC